VNQKDLPDSGKRLTHLARVIPPVQSANSPCRTRSYALSSKSRLARDAWHARPQPSAGRCPQRRCRRRTRLGCALRGPAKGRRKGFTETDYARLLDAAHQQLGGPIVLVWDNLNTHVSHTMRELSPPGYG
jgi:hypothetical protein